MGLIPVHIEFYAYASHFPFLNVPPVHLYCLKVIPHGMLPLAQDHQILSPDFGTFGLHFAGIGRVVGLMYLHNLRFGLAISYSP